MKKASSRFYCFSPPVMVATFTIELVLLLYTLIRYRMNVLTRLVSGILLTLAIFQIAEYKVCGFSDGSVWSRIGYMAITLLPAFGIHLSLAIAGKKWRWLLVLTYIPSILFAIIFGLSKTAFVNHICSGNYVIFQLTDMVGRIYFGYYYAWLFAGIGLSLYLSINTRKNIREALLLQVIGYLSFLLPTGFVNSINPTTKLGIPSIMCGFAIMYALILGFGVVPLVLSDRKGK